MIEKGPLSLDQMLRNSPPVTEIFKSANGRLIRSQVSRVGGQPVYFVPGSTKYVEELPVKIKREKA